MKHAARARRRRAYLRRLAGPGAYLAAARAARQHKAQIAIAAHDLKNTLSVITGFTDLLQQHLATAGTVDTERVAQGLAQIAEAAARLGAQIAELMGDDQSPDRGAHPRQPVDMVALVQALGASYQQMTARHQIRVVVLAPELVGNWDRLGLERVVCNLLSNAIKYSPGGGEIMITLAREDLVAGPQAILTIQDRGIGIPCDDLPLVFNPFQRAGNVGPIAGGGLGLTSTRRIVEQHGGTIAVTSQVDAGTTVTVRLLLEPR